MAEGHFHFHAGGVSRSKGYSAVKVAAYTSGQKLTHKQQLSSHLELQVTGEHASFTIHYDFRHELRQNTISDDLRKALAREGVELSEKAAVEKKKRGGFEIVDGEQTYHFRRTNTVDTLPLAYRKEINKGVLSEGLRHDLEQLDIHLSDDATVEKDNRRHWTITDGEKTYVIKEHEKKVKDAKTGKRRTAERVLHVYADKQHNFKTREDVKETGIFVPEYAATWLRNIEAKGKKVSIPERERAWNTVEGLDTAVDSKTAHRMHLSLSRGLTYEENRAALHGFVREQFTSKGLIADVAIHDKEASDGKPNLHAHVLVSTREIQKNGTFAKKKSDYWDKKERIQEWREAWADKQNTALERNGSDIRVDHRSYEKRKLDIIAGEHMGADWYRQERGEPTDTGRENAIIEDKNRKRDEQIEEIAKRIRAPAYTVADEVAYREQQAKQENHVYEPDVKALNTHAKRMESAEQMALRTQKRLERLKRKEIQLLKEMDENTVTTSTWWGTKTIRINIAKVKPIWMTETNPQSNAPRNTRDTEEFTHAFQETRIRFFGLGSRTIRTVRPGMANASVAQRKAWDDKSRYLASLDTEKKERFEQAGAYHLRTAEKLVGDNTSGSSTHTLKERLHHYRTWMREKVGRFRDNRQEKGKDSDKAPER